MGTGANFAVQHGASPRDGAAPANNDATRTYGSGNTVNIQITRTLELRPKNVEEMWVGKVLG